VGLKAARTRLPGLDGLRAIAVVGVLLYHAGVRAVPGGFLGVDIFFVISGFLITSILLGEAQRDGRLSLRRFYARRARRLLPALAAMLVVATAFMARFHPGDLAQARGDIAAATGYVSNLWYVLHHRSYFAAAGRPEPLQHLWSLAVEEQFYLIWPLLLAILLTVRARLRVITVVALSGALASALWMRSLAIKGNVPFDTDSSRVYFGTDTHASALLLGAAAAAVMAGVANRRARSGRRMPGALRAAIDLVGLAGVGVLVLAMHEVGYYTTPGLYRGGFLLIAAIGVIVVAIASAPGGWLGRVLDVAPMRVIGARSYGLYLWHWPVFVYTRPGLDWPLHGTAALAARLAVTAALSELSFRLVESPLRRRAVRTGPAFIAPKVLRSWRTFAPVFGSVVGVVGVIAATTFVVARVGHSPVAATTAAAAGALRPVSTSAAPVVSSAVSAPVDSTAPAATSSGPSAGTSGRANTPPSPPTISTPAGTPTGAPRTPVATRSTAPPAAPQKSPPVRQPTQEPTAPPPIPNTPPPLLSAVGDSVMVDAEHALARDCSGTEVYAVVGWQAKSVFAELAALRAAGHLGQVVVIETGTNGVVSPQELNAALAALADRTKVIVVNNHMDRPWEPANNAMLPAVVQAHPNAVLVDWDAAANSHPDWLTTDGVHLQPAGVAPYAALIKAAAGC
jgi:peptidoglycan/LPS O-acetylase OafA/YrhL